MIAEIRRLDPKPGLAFGSTLVQPVVPDVFVHPAPDGSWNVELNADTLPKVLINQRYYAQMSKTARADGDKCYLADCLQSATWLVRALDQRAKTILKVASEIVRQQDAFFARGVQHLRPLNLKTVADAIGMHELTVSRVTSNKYMATNRGIFELKYFFTAAIAAADGGEAHSAEAVRHRIKQLIDARERQRYPVRRHNCGQVARIGDRHRPPNRRKISGSDAHPVLGATPPRQAGRCRSGRLSGSAASVRRRERKCMNADGTRHAASHLGQESRRRRGAAPARRRTRCRKRCRKYFDGGYSGHVTIDRDGFGFLTECVIHLDSGIVLQADASAPDAYASADRAAIRMEKRLRRYKRRLKDRPAAGAGRAGGRGAELCDRRAGARRARPTWSVLRLPSSPNR